MFVELKCIKNRCEYYFSSDDIIHICRLNHGKFLDKCHGLCKIQDRKEELICKIAQLTNELEYINKLKELVKNNQDV